MIRYLTAGESHGRQLDVVIDGFPSNFQLSLERIDEDLAKRQVKLGSGPRQSIETDRVVANSGLMANLTTGSPLSFTVVNKDHLSWKDKEVDALTIPRPGHADAAGAFKYNLDDLRKVLERASARETATRVVVGSCCMQLLEALGVKVTSEVCSFGDSSKSAEENIQLAKQQGQTIGGIVKTVVEGVIPGLGSFVQHDRKLDAKIAAAIVSVQAVKGVEFGSGFGLAKMNGVDAQKHLGGFTGGMTDGSQIEIYSAIKPIPTTLIPQESVDLVFGMQAQTKYERSDLTAVFRVPIVISSVVACAILNEIIEVFGGDNFETLKSRWFQRKDEWESGKGFRVTADSKVFW